MVFEPNRRYREDADAEQWARHFEREGRDVWGNRELVLAAMKLRPGLRVVDVGAGTGTFSRPVARAVGAGGHVYAVEPMPHFIEALCKTSGEFRNLTVATEVSELADHCCDLAICIDSYHHLESPLVVMDEVHRVLVSGGRLLLVDLVIDGRSSEQLRAHVRRTQSVVESELARVGFVLQERLASLAHNYVLDLRRP